jgi:glycosyltransferase involved in cell wall biosynthesis
MQGCSIVIRAFNEGKNIGRLLRGISAQSVQDREVIIVDSGSTDGTLGVAGQYPVKVLHLSKDDFSFGRSLNMGCAAATGELIVLASAHVFPIYSDWLEELLEPFSDPRLALSYGKQRGTDRTQYAEHQVFAKWFPDISNPDQSHPFCNNANAAIRRSVWEKLPYDETLTGLEDIDWAQRASRMGYRIAYRAAAEVAHLHDETPMRTYNRYLREAIASQLREREAIFDFRIQLQSDAVKMPIEDPTVEWEEVLSPPTKVATITIPMQDINTPERRALDERQSFSPWHSLAAHQPLGGVNRARKMYADMARARNAIN